MDYNKDDIKYAVEDSCVCYGEYDSLEKALNMVRGLIMEDLIVVPAVPGHYITSHRYGIKVTRYGGEED